MTEQEFSEIKAAIQYMDTKPTLLSRFFNVKELLYEEIRRDPAAYKAESLFPNALNDNKIIKCVNILNARYTKDLKKYDLTAREEEVPSEAADFLRKTSVVSHDGKVGIKTEADFTGDVYIRIPRENALTLQNISVKGITFDLMNPFNLYVAEGFTLSFRRPDLWISIEPASLDGIKGSGELYVYVKKENAFYRDRASRYFDPDAVLQVFRG